MNKNKSWCVKKYLTIIRRYIKHLVSSGCIPIGIDHFLAMLPSTLLVPIYLNGQYGSQVIDPLLVLFSSGIGTIVFLIATGGKIPTYLGSSFAYIALTTFLLKSMNGQQIPPEEAYAYVGWSYIFSAIILAFLAWGYKTKAIRKIVEYIFPAAIIGPAISLIGLGLADTAAIDSGLKVEGAFDIKTVAIALTTLLIIIIVSVMRRRFFRNASILIGMLGGCLLAVILFKNFNLNSQTNTIIVMPNITTPLRIFPKPKEALALFLNVIPATLVVFIENISRTTVIERMRKPNENSNAIFGGEIDSKIRKSLVGHSISMLVCSIIGSVPNALYAENIAVLSINGTIERGTKKMQNDKLVGRFYDAFGIIPYIIAAILAILCSLLSAFNGLINQIPKSVIGGMELFLFGIISAPGIQLLVEQKVNYKKVSNQILTAAVLISGVGGFSIDLDIVRLEGMSLGLFIGIIINILFKIIERLGLLNEKLSFVELLTFALDGDVEDGGNVKKKSLIELYHVSPDAGGEHNELQEKDSDIENMINLQEVVSQLDSNDIIAIVNGDLLGRASKSKVASNTSKNSDSACSCIADSNSEAVASIGIDTADKEKADLLAHINPDFIRNYIECSNIASIGIVGSDSKVIEIRETSSKTMIYLTLPPEQATVLMVDYDDLIDYVDGDEKKIRIIINGRLSKSRIRSIMREAFEYALRETKEKSLTALTD